MCTCWRGLFFTSILLLMSSLVLYRKHRPSSWAQVIGQDHIVDVLKETIKQKHTAHAYLFSGSRGTGKTSVARILAKALGAAEEDVYEIDAASNRGIDDIRHLREHVSVLPFSSPVKVYIIDEVHMLSKDAWNALLKTLEEPPQHVVFILATTELDKVPDTIISRCQGFSFKRPSREVIRKEVTRVAKEEGYILDAGAGDLIALLGDGAFRDALGTLEKVISASSDKKLSREEVEKITGAPKAGLVNEFVQSVIAKNADMALATLGTAEGSGISLNTFVTLVLEKMRFILLAAHSASSQKEIENRVSPDDWEFIKAQAALKKLTPEVLATFLQAANDVGRARISALPLELAVVKTCTGEDQLSMV